MEGDGSPVDIDAFYITDGDIKIPRWIIRNGINDNEQDDGTYFGPFKPWNGKTYNEEAAPDAVNGNGAVRFRVMGELGIDFVGPEKFVYYVSNAGQDSNEGKTSATSFATISKALTQLKIDYTDWQKRVIERVGAVDKELYDYVYGVIYVSGTVSYG